MLMRDWSKEKLEARIEKTRGLIAALDVYLDGLASGMEKEARALRKAKETHLNNMEHVLKEKSLTDE